MRPNVDISPIVITAMTAIADQSRTRDIPRYGQKICGKRVYREETKKADTSRFTESDGT